MKLTPRQRTFLKKLVELYKKGNEAIHYSTIAAELGVNKFSAYDMLHLLEDKGMAISRYVLSNTSPGPGRSQVVFAPTAQGVIMAEQIESVAAGQEEWLSNRQHMLDILHEAQGISSWEELREALTRLPNTRSRLAYCGQIITALLMSLNVASLQASIPQLNLPSSFNSVIIAGESGLSALAGFSLGASFMQHIDSPVLDDLITHTKRYQSYLLTLSEESKSILTDFLREALVIVQKKQTV